MLPQSPAVGEAVDEDNKVRSFRGLRGSCFDVVELEACSEDAEAVVEAIRVVVEVPELLARCQTISFSSNTNVNSYIPMASSFFP